MLEAALSAPGWRPRVPRRVNVRLSLANDSGGCWTLVFWLLYTVAMSGEHSYVLPGTELSGCGQALAASRRENADLGKELETTVQKAEKWRCDAEMRQGAFHRALALKKRHEVPPLCRSAETTENERLKSRSRRFARELFGRRRGRRRGTPSHGRTQRPELPVREKEAIPDRRTYPDCGKVWVSNGWKDTEIVEVAAHARRIRRKRLRPACACRPEKEAVGPAPARLFPNTRYGVSDWAYVLAERPAPSAAFGLPRAKPARDRPRHVGGRPAGGPAPDRSTKRSSGACRRRRSFTETKQGGRELAEEDGGNARAWAARSADAVRIVAVAQRGSRP